MSELLNSNKECFFSPLLSEDELSFVQEVSDHSTEVGNLKK